MAQSETILSNQSHPGDSTIESHTGEKYKGDEAAAKEFAEGMKKCQ